MSNIIPFDIDVEVVARSDLRLRKLAHMLKLMTLPNTDILKQWDNADEEIDGEEKGKLESKASDDSDEEDEVVDGSSNESESD